MNSNIIKFLLLFVVLIIGLIIAEHYFPFDNRGFDDVALRQREIALISRNDSLIFQIHKANDSIRKLTIVADSLEDLKQKVRIIYKIKTNEIDKATTTVVVAEFDSLFTRAGIK